MRLSPGDPAPDFTLTTDDGSTVSLRDLRGSKVVLYVYPAALTPGCTTQAGDFRDELPVFADAGYRVLGLSPDPPEKLARFREQEALTFPLLSDASRQVLAAYGAYGQKQLYGKTVVGVVRSTFVLDELGTVVLAQYGVKAKGHVAKLRRDLALAEGRSTLPLLARVAESADAAALGAATSGCGGSSPPSRTGRNLPGRMCG